MHHDVVASGKITFSDLTEEQGLKMAKQMPEHSTVSFHGPVTNDGWKDVDVTYLLCEEDQIIPLEWQEATVERLRGEGKKVDVQRIRTGHCPNASQPELVVSVVRKVAGEDF